MSDLIFRRNLLALSRSDQSLGDKLMEAGADPALTLVPARSGAPVPVVRRGERESPMHSLVDPEREAERLEAAQPAGGFIVALGLGACYLLRRYMASSATTGLLAIEYSAPMLRALLEQIDLSELFIDERFSLLLDPSPDDLRDAILSLYVPPLSGDIRSLPLRGRVDLDRDSFGGAADILKAVLGRISDDYSVQAFFGKLWFKNAGPEPVLRRAQHGSASSGSPRGRRRGRPLAGRPNPRSAGSEGERCLPHRDRYQPSCPRRAGPGSRCGRVDRLPAYQLLPLPGRHSGRHSAHPRSGLPFDSLPTRRFGALLLLWPSLLRLRVGEVEAVPGPRYLRRQRDARGPLFRGGPRCGIRAAGGGGFLLSRGQELRARHLYLRVFRAIPIAAATPRSSLLGLPLPRLGHGAREREGPELARSTRAISPSP